MIYWTPTIAGEVQILSGTLQVFKSKKMCQEYISRTFPTSFLKFCPIEPRKISINLL